jgi:uncharacterized RDD family membrane protein YckC
MNLTENEKMLVQSMREAAAQKDYSVPFFAVVIVCFSAVIGTDAYMAFNNGGLLNLIPLTSEVLLYFAIFGAGYVSCALAQRKKIASLLD